MDSLGPDERRWTWEHPIPPRWLLMGDVGFSDSYNAIPLALCADIDGLFFDMPRNRERFTIVGCVPAGALAERLSTGERWLGSVCVWRPSPLPDGEPIWWGEDLNDVEVVAHRPSPTFPGTVDIDLDGVLFVNDRTDAVERPAGVTIFVLDAGDDLPYGTCRDVTGLFRERAEPPVPVVRLVGCRPEPHLSAALDAVGRPAIDGPDPRRMLGDVYLVAADGSVSRVPAGRVLGAVAAVEPSRAGAGLVDVTVHSEPLEPLPMALEGILERWRAGRPTEKNLWAGYSADVRTLWVDTASGRQSLGPDGPPGATYHLDGRHVTDIEGFYCALGEAINGPGGYFGSGLDALDDCLTGGQGARVPFTLVWHDSAVAHEHLSDGRGPTDLRVTTADRHLLRRMVSLEYLLTMFAGHGVTVDLR